MKEESLLGKLGTGSRASPARYRGLERPGEAFRGKRGDFSYLLVCIYWFVCSQSCRRLCPGPGALSSPRGDSQTSS